MPTRVHSPYPTDQNGQNLDSFSEHETIPFVAAQTYIAYYREIPRVELPWEIEYNDCDFLTAIKNNMPKASYLLFVKIPYIPTFEKGSTSEQNFF